MGFRQDVARRALVYAAICSIQYGRLVGRHMPNDLMTDYTLQMAPRLWAAFRHRSIIACPKNEEDMLAAFLDAGKALRLRVVSVWPSVTAHDIPLPDMDGGWEGLV